MYDDRQREIFLRSDPTTPHVLQRIRPCMKLSFWRIQNPKSNRHLFKMLFVSNAESFDHSYHTDSLDKNNFKFWNLLYGCTKYFFVSNMRPCLYGAGEETSGMVAMGVPKAGLERNAEVLKCRRRCQLRAYSIGRFVCLSRYIPM